MVKLFFIMIYKNLFLRDLKSIKRWDENYLYGSIILSEKEKPIVYSLKTKKFMDYFYEDLGDEEKIPINWILTEYLDIPNLNGTCYYINNKYELFCESKRKTMPPRNLLRVKTKQNKEIYPRICLSFGILDGRKIYKSIFVHRLVALIFIPNINKDSFNLVHHVDGVIFNNIKENLMWCDHQYNSLHTHPKINSVIDWKKNLDSTLDDYLSRHPFKDNIWKENKFIPFPKIEVNSNGVLRINGKLKVGRWSNKYNYYELQINSKNIRTHRLIYETWNGKLIEKDKVIDHIIPVSDLDINNEVSNLRLVSPKQNSMNKNTRDNLKVYYNKYDLTGKFIEKIVGKGRETNFISDGLRKSRLTSHGFIWCLDGNDEIVYKKLRYIYYRYNKSGILESGNCLSSVTPDHKKYHCLPNLYVNTGIPDPKSGYYYQQGFPENLIFSENNPNLEKFWPVLKWNGIE